MYSILCVDDEPLLLDIIQLFLERGGRFSVDPVSSAQKAIELLKVKNYDAVISDYQMPGMDGIELLKWIRKSGNTIPFILFTGRGREEVVIEALNSGADFYLQKGGEPESQFTELAHHVRQAIQKRQAEIRVRDLERREADIINFLPDATFAIDTRGTVIEWNRAMEKMTGIPAGQLLGKGNYEYALPFYGKNRPILINLVCEPDEIIHTYYPDFRKEESLLVAEVTFPDFNGRHSTLSAKATPLFNNTGKIVGAIESIRDITDQKVVENTIRAAEEKFSTIFRQSPDVIWITELESSRFVDVNDAAERILGYTREELIGKKSLEIQMWVNPPDRESLIRMLAEEKWVNRFETLLRRKDTEIFHAAISASIISIHGRHYLIGTARDVSEVKLAEEALRESEQKYRTLIDTANEGIFIVQDGILVFANRRAYELSGRSLVDLIGKPVDDLICPEDRDLVVSRHWSRQKGEPVPDMYDFRIVTPVGIPRWISLSVTPVKWQGRPATLNLVTDITHRKQMEKDLRQLEEKFSTIYRQNPDIIWISDLVSGRFVDSNDAAERILGYSREDLIGKTSLELGLWVDPDDRATLMRKIRTHGRVDRFKTRHRKKNGKIIDVESSVSTIILSGKKYLIASVRDVSGITRTEKRLKESKQKYNILMNEANEAILIAQNERLVYANPSASRLFKTSHDALMERRFIDVIWPEDRELVLNKFRERMSGNNITDTYDLRIVDADHTLRWASMSVARIQWKGRPAALCLMTDITDRKHAEHSLREANKRLNLLSSITRHDIKNQLTILRGYLTLLEMNLPDPELKDHFQKITAISQRISSMIQFTKEYDEIGASAPRWHDVHDLLNTTAQQASLSDILIRNDIPMDTELYADPLIARVFYNLLDNAQRYGEKITSIRFSLEHSEKSLRIICEDDGVGVALDEKERIFERGYGKNTGMGLFLSREILGITGITLTETGEPGKGARFEIFVPDGMWRKAAGSKNKIPGITPTG